MQPNYVVVLTSRGAVKAVSVLESHITDCATQELKLDGYRALAIKTDGKVQLRSRNNDDFSVRYQAVVQALTDLPRETIIDGEVVAFDDSGRPSFNRFQNYGSSKVPIFYYAFDLPMLAGRDLRSQTLDVRRDLLRTKVLSKLREPVRYSPVLNASLPELIRSLRQQGLEGVVAKRIDSVYESGQRSGAWRKMRINQGQEFVIGGYTPTPKNFDALIFGYYEGEKLIYVARTRNGFTPALREQIFKHFRSRRRIRLPPALLAAEMFVRWSADGSNRDRV